MIVWCTVVVLLFGDKVETAVKARVISETLKTYTIDFQNYANIQKYTGDYTEIEVNKDNCIKN